MMPVPIHHQAHIPPPSYQHAQAKAGKALHINALALVTHLHLLTFCHLAVRLAHRRCPPPLPKGPGGAPRRKLAACYTPQNTLETLLSRYE
jgi:hypothetical protein